MKKLVILTFLSILFKPCTAQLFNWAVSEPHPVATVKPVLVTSDVFGNVVMAGYRNSSSGVFLIKYDPNGFRMWDTLFSDYGSLSSIATDESGNVYMTYFIVHMDGDTYHEEHGNFLIKFDPVGNVLWRKRPGMGMFLSERTSETGQLILTGGYNDTCILENGYSLTGPGARFMAKYSTEGECTWAQERDGGRYSLVVNESTEMLATGEVSWGTTVGKDSNLVTLYPPGIYHAKYDSLGNLIYVTQNNSTFAAMDQFGNSYLFTSNRITKHDPEGNQVWQRTYIHTPSWGKGKMKCDALGNLFVTAGFSNSLTIDDTTITVSGSEAFVAKIDSSGVLQWVTVTSGSGSAGAKDISIGDDGAIFITGDMSGSVSFGPHTVTETSGVFVAKLLDVNVTGIKENPEASTSFSIFPNPGSGIFQLSYSADEASKVRIEIHNATGQLIWSGREEAVKTFTKSVDLSEQPKGIYFVQVAGEKNRSVKKIVKQ